MEERVYYISLYDYYNSLLTLKQRKYFEDYYYENLTMEEIAENDNISKNAVSKQIILIKEKLDYYEDNLKLNYNKNKIVSLIDEDILKKIEDYI